MKSGTLAAAGRIAAAWIPAVLLVVIFTPQGLAKFDDASGWSAAFRAWGYPVWFRMLIGVIEVLAVACLLWGRTAIYGAAMIVAVMLGGMATHIIQDGGRHLTSEVVPLTLATIILIVRRREVTREIRVGRVVSTARSLA
jgi:putative oxidoreductase